MRRWTSNDRQDMEVSGGKVCGSSTEGFMIVGEDSQQDKTPISYTALPGPQIQTCGLQPENRRQRKFEALHTSFTMSKYDVNKRLFDIDYVCCKAIGYEVDDVCLFFVPSLNTDMWVVWPDIVLESLG